ncbi:MAG: hypothetical protein V2A73_09765 [Pseudomonadota bacterium]
MTAQLGWNFGSLATVFHSIEKAVKTTLGRPFRFRQGKTDMRVPIDILKYLGRSPTIAIANVERDFYYAIAIDLRFAVRTAGTYMMLNNAGQEERIAEGAIDGLLAETVTEIVNIVSGRTADGFREVLGDPREFFPPAVISSAKNLPNLPTIALTVGAEMDGDSAGQLVLWLSKELATRLSS